MSRPRRYKSYGAMLPTQQGSDQPSKSARRRPCKFFFTNAKCLKGEACPYSHDLLEIGFCSAAVEWLELQWLQDRSFFQKMALDHPVEKWFTQRCSFHSRGYCDRGMLCTFVHEEKNENFNNAGSTSTDWHGRRQQSPPSLDPATAAFTPAMTGGSHDFGMAEGSKFFRGGHALFPLPMDTISSSSRSSAGNTPTKRSLAFFTPTSHYLSRPVPCDGTRHHIYGTSLTSGQPALHPGRHFTGVSDFPLSNLSPQQMADERLTEDKRPSIRRNDSATYLGNRQPLLTSVSPQHFGGHLQLGGRYRTE